MSDRTSEIASMNNTGSNRGRLYAITLYGTTAEKRAAEARLREWKDNWVPLDSHGGDAA